MTITRIGLSYGTIPLVRAVLMCLASASGAAAQVVPAAPPPEAPQPFAPAPPGTGPGGEVTNGFRFKPRATVEISFTDNVALTTTNRKADYVTSPTVGFNLSGGTPRTRITADATAFYDFYGATTRFNGHRVEGLLNAKTELLEGDFTLNANAATKQQEINPAGASPVTGRSFGQNQAQVLTYGATPTMRFRSGDIFSAEASYDISAVNYYQTAVSTTPVPANNTVDQTISVRLVSGPAFQRLSWTANASLSREDQTGPNSVSDRRVAEGSLLFALYPNFQLVATGGYDDIVEPTLTQKLGGIHATGGFRWYLSPRTNITFDAGRRYNKPNYNGVITYSPRASLSLHASYTQTIDTPQRLARRNLAGLIPGPGGLIDPITGLPGDPTDNPFGINNQAFRRNALEFGVSGKLGRTLYNVSGTYERRNTGGASAKNIGGQVSVSRILSPHITGTVLLGYDKLTNLTGVIAIPGAGKTETVNARADLSYKLGARTNVVLYYDYQRKQVFPGNIIENVAGLTLNRTF